MTHEKGVIGKAYGFFYYPGRAKDISKVLPQIIEDTETPSELTLDLVAGVDNLLTFSDIGNDSALVDIVQRAKQSHMSHVLIATLPGMKNVRAANYLGNIMNGIYSKLYEKSEPVNGGIVYQRGEQYVFRRN